MVRDIWMILFATTYMQWSYMSVIVCYFSSEYFLHKNKHCDCNILHLVYNVIICHLPSPVYLNLTMAHVE